jgi:hypothetical protein
MFVEELSQEELEAELAAQAAHVDAGVCRLLELVAECERRLQPAGDTSFAAWLAWRCSLLPRQAREQQRVAGRLAELPLIHEAFACGELSYAKVGVLARVAEPESEQELLELAKALTASQLQRAVAAFQRVSTEQAGEQQAREFVSWFWEEDGSLALRARLAADDGAVVLRALEAAREAVRGRRRADEAAAAAADADADRHADECRVSNAEALVAVADLALANADGDRPGGERCQLVVHVDAGTLSGDGEGRCELAEGVAIAAETARRLACDGSVVELLERDGVPLALGRRRRTVSPGLRRALGARDRGCCYPGCDSTRFVEAHHVEHWAQGGETSLGNLILLCRRHHRLLHEQRYTVRFGEGGEPRFVNQHGVAIPSVPRPPPGSGPEALRLQHGRLLIDGRTLRPGAGDRMNLALAVDAIAGVVSARAAA